MKYYNQRISNKQMYLSKDTAIEVFSFLTQEDASSFGRCDKFLYSIFKSASFLRRIVIFGNRDLREMKNHLPTLQIVNFYNVLLNNLIPYNFKYLSICFSTISTFPYNVLDKVEVFCLDTTNLRNPPYIIWNLMPNLKEVRIRYNREDNNFDFWRLPECVKLERIFIYSETSQQFIHSEIQQHFIIPSDLLALPHLKTLYCNGDIFEHENTNMLYDNIQTLETRSTYTYTTKPLEEEPYPYLPLAVNDLISLINNSIDQWRYSRRSGIYLITS